MTTRHPNADILIAFAEGKTIQFYNQDRWVDFRGESDMHPDEGPWDVDTGPWRVKPEKKIGWVVVLNSPDYFVGGSKLYPTKEAALAAWRGEQDFCRVRSIIQITYEEGEGL